MVSLNCSPPRLVSVRLATKHDVTRLAALFAATFPNHQVARLPTPLQEAFMRAHVTRNVTTVAIDARAHTVLGFAIASTSTALDRIRREFIVRNIVHLIRHAASRRGSFLRRRACRTPAAPPPAAVPGELRFLAVVPHGRRLGIGAALLRSVEDELGLAPPYNVWTLESREPALHFYRKHGFNIDYAIDGHVRMVKPQNA